MFLLVPSDMLESLGKPDLLPMLRACSAGGNPVVLILEDADSALVPRSTDNISRVSALLNYTDDMFGDILNIRVIATTNAKRHDYDEALMRKGRLMAEIQIGLPSEETKRSIMRRLLKADDFSLPATAKSLGDVYSAAREQGWQPSLNIDSPPPVSEIAGRRRMRAFRPIGFEP